MQGSAAQVFGESAEESRRAYREMLFTSPDMGEFISGAIMHDETIRQSDSGGTPLAEVLEGAGILPGIKAGQRAFRRRAGLNGAACLGDYTDEMEAEVSRQQ
jgi:fructose-bisphosphate aldolase class 1